MRTCMQDCPRCVRFRHARGFEVFVLLSMPVSEWVAIPTCFCILGHLFNCIDACTVM